MSTNGKVGMLRSSRSEKPQEFKNLIDLPTVTLPKAPSPSKRISAKSSAVKTASEKSPVKTLQCPNTSKV